MATFKCRVFVMAICFILNAIVPSCINGLTVEQVNRIQDIRRKLNTVLDGNEDPEYGEISDLQKQLFTLENRCISLNMRLDNSEHRITVLENQNSDNLRKRNESDIMELELDKYIGLSFLDDLIESVENSFILPSTRNHVIVPERQHIPVTNHQINRIFHLNYEIYDLQGKLYMLEKYTSDPESRITNLELGYAAIISHLNQLTQNHPDNETENPEYNSFNLEENLNQLENRHSNLKRRITELYNVYSRFIPN